MQGRSIGGGCRNKENIGIAAGGSTPDWLIKERSKKFKHDVSRRMLGMVDELRTEDGLETQAAPEKEKQWKK